MPLQPTPSTSDECFIAEESLTDNGEQDTLRDTIKKHWNMTIVLLNHFKCSRQYSQPSWIVKATVKEVWRGNTLLSWSLLALGTKMETWPPLHGNTMTLCVSREPGGTNYSVVIRLDFEPSKESDRGHIGVMKTHVITSCQSVWLSLKIVLFFIVTASHCVLTRRNAIPATNRLSVHTRRDYETQQNQSKKSQRVGGVFFQAHCTCNKMELL